METLIQKWGNSQGLRIPRQLLAEAHINVGDQVSLAIEDEAIIIRKAARNKFDLAKLVAQIPADYQTEEVSFGAPVGKEVW